MVEKYSAGPISCDWVLKYKVYIYLINLNMLNCFNLKCLWGIKGCSEMLESRTSPPLYVCDSSPVHVYKVLDRVIFRFRMN